MSEPRRSRSIDSRPVPDRGRRPRAVALAAEARPATLFALVPAFVLALALAALTVAALTTLAPRAAEAHADGTYPRIFNVDWSNNPNAWLNRRYEAMLGWTLRHRALSASLAFLFFVASVAAFIPVNKSAFTGSKVEAVRMEYEFADNLNQHEVEKYVSHVESWILARKDSLHVKSTYSFFTHNYAFTRAYQAKGYADDHGAEIVRKLLRQGLPTLPGTKLKIAGADDDSDASRLTVNVFGDPGPRLN